MQGMAADDSSWCLGVARCDSRISSVASVAVGGIATMPNDTPKRLRPCSTPPRAHRPPLPPPVPHNRTQHGFLDLAADVMAENPGYCQTLLQPELREYLEAAILRKSSPADALRRCGYWRGRGAVAAGWPPARTLCANTVVSVLLWSSLLRIAGRKHLVLGLYYTSQAGLR